MAVARWIFWLAGAYGLFALVPHYFLLAQIGRDAPPAVTHVEYFYGFVGVAIAWQLAFLVIGSDPQRYRPLMLVAVVEKLSFFVPAMILSAQGRLSGMMTAAGAMDGMLAIAFIVAWLVTRRAARGERTPGT